MIVPFIGFQEHLFELCQKSKEESIEFIFWGGVIMSAIFVEKTSHLSLHDLYDRIDSANKELNRLCKRSDSVRQNVEKLYTEKLLPEFNFFSLTHEGICLSFEEIKEMTEGLLTASHKEGDIPNLVIEDSSSHIRAATKHIRMSGRIRV